MSGSPVSVSAVRSRGDLRDFIILPFRLYRGDPYWVPPLISERRAFLDPARNPFFRHAEVALWLARRGGQVVGRISSHVDRRHDQTHGERAGMFGFFECVDDGVIAEALLERARAWCRERGAQFLRGPLSFSLNHECGLLVDGWDGPPTFMLAYNPTGYAAILERCGLTKEVDLLSFTLERSLVGGDPGRLPAVLVAGAETARREHGMTLRRAEMGSFDAEVAVALEIFRQAWRSNWGFVAPDEREARALGRGLKRIVEPAHCFFVEHEGRPVGFSMVAIDVNQVLIHLGGRLFPLGWLKALWYARRVTRLRLMLFGVLEEHRGKGVEALLMLETLKTALASRYPTLELSWILENNAPVNHLIAQVGGPYGVRVHRRYRIYRTAIELSAAAADFGPSARTATSD
jgi:GNAT superfamily N-acetyltransferase